MTPDLAAPLGLAALVPDPSLVGTAALVATRLLPIVWLAPFLGGAVVSGTTRSVILVALTVVVTPLVPGADVAGPAAMLGALAVELSRGLVLGFALALPFHAFEWAGRLADQWRGSGVGPAPVDPITGEASSPLGVLHRLLAVVLFMSAGGHLVALTGIVRDFRARAPGVAVGFRGDLVADALGAARTAGDALALALVIAAPVGVAVVVAELFLGLLARAAPQVPVFFAGMPLRAAWGIAAVALSGAIALGHLEAWLAVRAASPAP